MTNHVDQPGAKPDPNKAAREKLAALKTKQAEFEVEDEGKRLNAEIANLEEQHAIRALVTKYEQEIGKRGEAFELIDTMEGPVVVKLGEGITYTKMRGEVDKSGGTLHLADAQDFVLPNLVYPTREAYIAMCQQRTGIPRICANALMLLFQGRKEREAGK